MYQSQAALMMQGIADHNWIAEYQRHIKFRSSQQIWASTALVTTIPQRIHEQSEFWASCPWSQTESSNSSGAENC